MLLWLLVVVLVLVLVLAVFIVVLRYIGRRCVRVPTPTPPTRRPHPPPFEPTLLYSPKRPARSTCHQDMEPEYITVTDNSKTAYVTLQVQTHVEFPSVHT